MRRVLPWLNGLALALGVIHLGLAILAFRNWGAELLWFAVSGLAIIVAGLLNLVMSRAASVDRVQKAAWVLANLVIVLFFGAAWTVLPQPQVAVGGVVFALLTAGAAMRISGAGTREAGPASL